MFQKMNAGKTLGKDLSKSSIRGRLQKFLFFGMASFLLVLGGVFLFGLGQNAQAESAPWYDPSWGYRKTVDLRDSGAGTLVARRVHVRVIYNNYMKPDFSDVRFTSANGNTFLGYKRASFNSSASADFYVEVPVSSGSTIYMYYGNGSAQDASSTASYFDGFYDPLSWKSLKTLPSPLSDLTSAVVDGKFYIIGGFMDTAAKSEVWAYDPARNIYTAKTNLINARWGMIAVPFGGKIYVFGGTGLLSNTVLKTEVFDTAKNTWTENSYPPAALQAQGLFGAASEDYIYLFYNSSLYRYDTHSDTYTLLNSTPPHDIFSWGTMVNYGNKLYIFGGYGKNLGARDYVMVYNLTTNRWETDGASMPVALYGMVRENPIIGDKVYLVQGQRAAGEFFSNYWIYDISADSWSAGASGPWAANGVAGGVLGDKVYTFGGHRESPAKYGTSFAGAIDTTLEKDIKWVEVVGGPSDFRSDGNYQDGDIVKTANNPDVYILKIKNGKRYKRLILSPSVFNSYGHLKWGNIKIISADELGSYATSILVKETYDTKIYALYPYGDTGERSVVTIAVSDPDAVYEINAVDRDSYKLIN